MTKGCRWVKDRSRRTWRWLRTSPWLLGYGLLFVYITAVGGFVWNEIRSETNERRHQNCITFERDHQADIRTYRDETEDYRNLLEYVEDIPVGERDTQLNRAIIRSVPEARADLDTLRDEAMSSQPPAYCDEEGVGLSDGRSKGPTSVPGQKPPRTYSGLENGSERR